MIKKDWHFSNENYICNFRSVGVLIRDNKLLVQRDKNGNEYALPGGHVGVGETSEETLIREFKEETGADIVCNRLIWVEESFWKWGNRNAHTIAFYYLVSLCGCSDIEDNGDMLSQKDNYDVVLSWVSLDKVRQLNIYPAFVKDKIRNITGNIEHVISKD